MKKGVPVSPGVAVAKAHCVEQVRAPRRSTILDDSAIAVEARRFERALATAGKELDGAIDRIHRQVGEDAAAIFRAHRLLLRDPILTQKVLAAIREHHVDSGTALLQTMDDYQKLFTKVKDPYLAARMDDLRDVVNRILDALAQDGSEDTAVTEPVILVASEILPSQALTFDRNLIAGIVTEKGGATAHAAILAHSPLGIPAVSGLPGLLREVACGDMIALDGREGHVYVRPSPEVETAYRKLQREYASLVDRLVENRDQPPLSADGVAFELLANVNSAADAALAVKAGCSAVGLYRTEYLFLTHPTVPDEEEQLAAYRAIIEASPNRTVTIRTLDLGGDKQVAYLGQQDEANPFMGFRSIRLASAYPEFFATQLRAIFRAGLHGKVSVMFPMISNLEEVLEIKKVVLKTRKELQKKGIPYAEDMPVGIMLEVPAAALCLEEILREVDFISIGSNDLIQYLMAADRDNPRVAHLCEPFSPALLRLLARIIKTCDERGKPATLCGEMAGRPRCVLPLFGMGLRKLSMSPGFVPTVKEVLRHTTLAEAEAITQRALRMSTLAEIRNYLTMRIQQIWPNLNLLDMRR